MKLFFEEWNPYLEDVFNINKKYSLTTNKSDNETCSIYITNILRQCLMKRRKGNERK